jgi:tetratricopeptide (TPR) repeat protein
MLPAGSRAAEEEPTAEEVKRAEELFVEGRDAYEDGRYAQALVAFLDSFDIYPADELLYNIAFCYEKLDQDNKAVEYYERYLESLPEDAEKERAGVLARVEAIEVGGAAAEGGDAPEVGGVYAATERGGWMHGVWVAASMDSYLERGGYFPNDDRAGLGVRAAYDLRLLERRLALAVELGFLSIGYYGDHDWSLVLGLGAGYRVGRFADGAVQIYVGGALDLKYIESSALRRYGTLAVGGFARLLWHWSRKTGFLFEVMPALGIVPAHMAWSGAVHGYVAVKVGFVFGIK